jgi:predicted negative regulator of RcsB-dependent stress response
MSSLPPWERVKRARLFQIVVIYLGACWFVLQLVGTLQDLLDLPDWLGPVTLVLLGIGLVVVTATAWVQSLDSTTAAEQAGDRPTDWQVAPADALARLRSGRLPQLTWGRAIVGGAVALSLAIGSAGAYVLLVGSSGLLGPTEAGADGVPTAIAVLPFEARGQDSELWREGMVDMLSINLEGLGGIRTINSGTVISRWKSRIGDEPTAELADALSVAGSLDARFAVRGSIVITGAQVRIVADVFDVDQPNEARVDGVRVEGQADDMLALVDELTVELAHLFLGRTDGGLDRFDVVGTTSVVALEAFLRGEALFRESRFTDAIEAYEEAVTEDDEFALAYRGLLDAWGWYRPGGADPDDLERMLELASRLPPRERLLTLAGGAISEGRSDFLDELRAFVARNPDDAEAWYELSEYLLHLPWYDTDPATQGYEVTLRAVELMPNFTPFYQHLLGYLINRNDRGLFQQLMQDYERAGADPGSVEGWNATWDFYLGSATEQAEAERLFDTELREYASTPASINIASETLVERGPTAHAYARDLAEPLGIWGVFTAMSGQTPDPAGADPNVVAFATLVRETLIEPAQPVPEQLQRALEDGPSPAEALATALTAARAGDRATVERAMETLEAQPLEDRTITLGLYLGAATNAELQSLVDAAFQLREGDAAGAARAMRTVVSEPRYDAYSRLVLGDAEAASGNMTAAMESWESLMESWFRTHARLRLGRAHEALGNESEALEHYRGFLALTRNADADLAPVIQEVTEAIERLEG